MAVKKITEYFPVRRSNRRTSKEIEAKKMEELKIQIQSSSNERDLQIYTCPIKGRGIRAKRSFCRNEFVIEYKGDIISYQEARKRESIYSEDNEKGSYMYFFKHRGESVCIDATEETKFKGRLINHSALKPNLRTKVLDKNFYIIF